MGLCFITGKKDLRLHILMLFSYRSVINIMEEDMLLYVISDHGSTKTGDHGGDSKIELEASMFVYSPVRALVKKELVLASDMVKQVDLVPTMATVLGVPIPFSSLGSIIFDAIPTERFSVNQDWQYCLISLWKNIQQITTYIDQYSKTSDQFNPTKLETLDVKYKELLFRINSVRNDQSFQSLIKDAREYMNMARQMCEDVWIQFDSFSMSRGLLLMFLTIFFGYMIIDGIPNDRLPEIFMSSFIFCSYLVVLVVGLASVGAWCLDFVDNLELTLFFATGMSSIFMLAMLVIQNWEVIAINWYDSNINYSWYKAGARLIILLSISGLFSNSYIIEEASVLLFLTLTIIWLIVYETVSPKFKSKTVLFLTLFLSFLIRFAQSYWRCREESTWCANTIFHHNEINTKVNTKFETVITLIILALFVTCTRIWLRSCGNLVGFKPLIILTRYSPTVIVVLTGGFWILHELPKETKLKIAQTWQIDLFVWIIYVIIAVAVVLVILQPLCIYVIPKKKKETQVYGDKNIIPQLFNHVKGLYKAEASDTSQTPIVCGLATVYSAVYVVISIFVLLLVGLLLGDTTAVSAVLMYAAAVLTLVIIALAQYEKAHNMGR